MGFFSNFLLMASFVGAGIGIVVGRSGKLPGAAFGFLLLASVLVVARAGLDLKPAAEDEIFFTIEPAGLGTWLVIPLLVLLAMLVMAAAALPLGPLLRALPPLQAYAIDVAGSLAGTGLFFLLSWLWQPPAVWFLVLAALRLLVALPAKKIGWILEAVALAGAVALAWTPDRRGLEKAEETWSPYYRVTVYPTMPGFHAINVNGVPHQLFGPTEQLLARTNPYDMVYRWAPGRKFERVLIVGAGNGLDVAVHLSKGAGHVDAVEIDPLIASIGKALHPDKPYANEKVSLVIDDGRSFLRRAGDRRWDLVVFAAPDSLALVSQAASLRVESFLFTRECFESVRDHLAPGGIFVLSNVYWKPWLVQRLARTLEEVFGAPPVAYGASNERLLTVLAAGPGLSGPLPPGAGRIRTDDAPAPATDDWPFPYLRGRGLPVHYLLALGGYLAIATLLVLGAARTTGLPLSGFSPHFFALGVAFLLLETRSLVTFGLLFGTTWTVNALAIAAILLSVLLAIAVQSLLRPPRLPLYLALFAALAASALLRPDELLSLPPAARWTAAALVAFAPVFFANLVFTRSFADARMADMAFASNLLGAALGGALEYLSLAIGYRALVPVVALAYALALLFATRARFLADREDAATLVASPDTL